MTTRAIHEPKPPRQFDTLATIDGYDVIDVASGHPVGHRDSSQSANGFAYMLNNAARAGSRELQNVLARVR